MQNQMTVRVPASLNQALRAAARRMNRRSSEIVRMAVAAYLGLNGEAPDRPADRVRGLIGALHSGIPDLAERHRDYVIESLKRGR